MNQPRRTAWCPITDQHTWTRFPTSFARTAPVPTLSGPAAPITPGRTASAPTGYTVANSGSYTLYPWAKDLDGNVSAVYGSPASVSACGARHVPGT